VIVLAASGNSATFDTAVLVFGVLLMGGALLSGLARRSFLSLTALFVLCGFALARVGSKCSSSIPAAGSCRRSRSSRLS